MCACSNANVASAFGRNDPDEIGAAYFPLTEIIAKDLSTNQFALRLRGGRCQKMNLLANSSHLRAIDARPLLLGAPAIRPRAFVPPA